MDFDPVKKVHEERCMFCAIDANPDVHPDVRPFVYQSVCSFALYCQTSWQEFTRVCHRHALLSLKAIPIMSKMLGAVGAIDAPLGKALAQIELILLERQEASEP